MSRILEEHGLLSDTANLDFTAIPYWGDEDPFENNWSGKRSKALISIQAALAQDPDSGILCYGDTTVKHDNQNDVILEFMDFYYEATGRKVSYLVFDSKFTTLENLGRVNEQGIKFITIQRKSKNLNEKIDQIPDAMWKKAKVEKSNNKSRTVLYHESTTTNKRYGEQEIRQIFIKGSSIKPSTIMTNDFKLKSEDVIRRYSRRWLVEGDISEQVHFFHLNRNCSGIVVKVDFDLTMTILAHNLYRLICHEYARYGFEHFEAQTMFDRLISGSGYIATKQDHVCVNLKKKRNHTQMLEVMPQFSDLRVPWLNDATIEFKSSSTT
jgi:hypothetical protein